MIDTVWVRRKTVQVRAIEQRTTIIDVARAAGVSHKTVSRVLNGEPHVRPALKERVLAAVAQLDYRPNLIAKALVQRRSYLIGLVYENPSPSYVVELQMGVLERLTNERYRLIVIPVRSVRNNAPDIVALLRSAALDGVVLAPPASDHPDILEGLRAAGIAYSRIGSTRQLEIGANNLLDDVCAAREMADYLIKLGHRDIAIIKGDATHHSSEARLIGYSQAMASAGIAMRVDWIEQGNYTFESGFESAKRLLASKDRPTAILAQNDDMAVGALMAARDIGLAIPGDISIVGFDDSEVSRIVWPRLTTVRQPVYEMAVSATDMVIAQLANRQPMPDKHHAHTLIVRESAAPPTA
jgi:LacI family transcriptional regulator